jgi:3-methyladenine DNA glycosylase AlkD
MDVGAVVAAVQQELRALANPVRAEGEKRYLKSDFVHIGVGMPATRRIAVDAVRDGPSRAELRALAGGLWAATEGGAPVHEMRIAAIEVLIRGVKLLGPDDVEFAERLIRDSPSWAYVDALAVKVVGALVVRHQDRPDLGGALDRFVRDENFWIRRTALLALLPGLKAGGSVRDGHLTRLSRYGDLLIDEKEFFIRKALGWVLREVSRRDPEWVTAWVAPRVRRMSGVTIREAVRHLPEADRERLMAAYRNGRARTGIGKEAAAPGG